MLRAMWDGYNHSIGILNIAAMVAIPDNVSQYNYTLVSFRGAFLPLFASGHFQSNTSIQNKKKERALQCEW